MRIYRKLTIASLILVIIPMLFVVYIIFYTAKNSLEKEIFSKLETITNLKVDKLETFFTVHKDNLNILQNRNVVRTNFPILDQFSRDKYNPSYIETKKAVDSQLIPFQTEYQYANVILANKEGKVIYASDPAHDLTELEGYLPSLEDEIFRKAKNGIYIGDVFKTSDKEHPYIVFMAGLVYDVADNIFGLAVLEISMGSVYKFMGDNIGLGESGEILLVKRTPDNQVLFLSPLRYDPEAVLRKTITLGEKDGIPAQKAALGESGSGISIDYRGKKVLSIWRTIPSLGWGLVTKVDEQEAFSPIKRLTKLFLTVLAIITLLTLFSVLKVAKSISDPIHELHRGTEIIGNGNLDYKVGKNTKDEIGQLSRAFDTMTESLKNSTTSIENLNQEIAERKRAEEAQKESEEKYRTLIENQGEGVGMADIEERFIFANPAAECIFGVPSGGLIGRNLSEFTTPEQFTAIQAQTEKRQKGVKNSYEVEILRPDGEKRFLLITAAPRHDRDGTFTGTFGVFRDITERKRAEETLRESEERYKALFEGSPEGILVADIETKEFKYANAAICNMLGYTKEELIHMSITDIHPQEAIEHVISEFEAQARGEKKLAPQIPCLRKDGIIIYTDVATAKILLAGRECNVGFFTDITERKWAEKALQENEEKFRAISTTAKDAIILMDNDGNISYWNPSAEQIFGYSSQEAIGMDLHSLIAPRKYYEEYRKGFTTFKETGQGAAVGKNLELEAMRKDGTILPVEMSLASIKINDQWHAVGIVRDITERKQTEMALLEAKKQAEEANRFKSEFLANMSHEIRTPMNAIIGMTGIVLETDITGEQREYLGIVKESAYALLGLIDDILDLSKIEAGRVELETIDFDLRVAMESVADTLATRASFKGLELACMISPDIPIYLRGDPTRLRQIMINLGGNAIKFTEKGEVALRAELQEETSDRATILFSVTDTGIGIPEDKQGRIFESFTQADGSTTRNYGGTGLGLSISKQLVELMGGEIGVESHPMKGSHFWFTVTLEKQKELKDVLPSLSRPEISKKSILAVDDNQTNRIILVKMIESFGCPVEAVESGGEALQVLKRSAHEKNAYDLVLLDMQMPGMDGEETLRAIKGDQEIKDVPVIILTSIGERGDVARLEGLGCAGYLTKPIKQSQLLDTIFTVLSLRKTETKEKPIPIVTQHTVAEQNRQKVRILVAEDNPINMKLAVTLLKRAGYSVDSAENGKIVIQLLRRTAYDLIFMDVQMPQMDGFEAIKVIREMEGEEKHTPVIAMTAHAMKGDRERCLKAGMDDYVSKPIEPKEMFTVLEKWTKSSDKKERLLPVGKSKEEVHNMDIPIDLETTLKRFDGDREFFREMILEFLDSMPKKLQRLNDAVKKGNVKMVEREAHGLKGVAGNLGAKNLADSALKLELLGRNGDLSGALELIEFLKNELKRVEDYVSDLLKEESVLKS